METHKTLATYVALGVVLVIVLGLLAGGLVWACRRWRCPYPCCCVWRCFQDPDQLRAARSYLYTAPRDISWGIRRRWPSLTMQVGLLFNVPVLYQRLLCAILYCTVLALFSSSNSQFYSLFLFTKFTAGGVQVICTVDWIFYLFTAEIQTGLPTRGRKSINQGYKS